MFTIKMLRKSAVLFPLLFVTFQSNAAITCGAVTGSQHNNVTIPLVGITDLTIGDDKAIGDVIYAMKHIPTATKLGFVCNWTAADAPVTMRPQGKGKIVSAPLGGPVTIGSRAVFPTNVSGVGISVTPDEDTPFGGSGSNAKNTKIPYTIAGTPMTVTNTVGQSWATEIPASLKIELIKTGPIASAAQISASSFPKLQYTIGLSAPKVVETAFMTVGFSGAINVVSRTCQIDDVNVELGKYPISDFSQYQAGTEWKNFNVTLRNCPPFYGYNDYHMNFIYFQDTKQINKVGSIKTNRIDLQFTSVHGINANTDIMLETGPDAAEGIAIQMKNLNNNQLVDVSGSKIYNTDGSNNPWMALTNTNNGTYVIPLAARYYRYDSNNVKGGTANGAVTFTVSYY